MNTSHTPAYIIFHYLFEVYIPQHYLYSDSYIETFGLPTTMDSDIDRALSESPTLSQQTISNMAELLEAGATLTLKDPKKSEFIYNTISEHINTWNNKVKNALFDVNPPLEDLRLLDNLASEIYPMAKMYGVKPKATGLMSVLDKLNTGGLSIKSKIVDSKNERITDNRHVSVIGEIKKEVFNHRRNWSQ